MQANKNRFYVVDGVPYPLADEIPAEYLLDNAESLSELAEHVLPGSKAYLPVGSREWVMGPVGKWMEKTSLYEADPQKFDVKPMDGDETVFGHTVSDLQSGVFVGDNVMNGTLKYVSSGSLVTTWGAGNFIALQFSGTAFDKAENIYVGLDPSVSSGLVDVIDDPDKNGVFKVSSKLQRFKAVIDYGSYTETFEWDLSKLTLNNS